MYCFHILVHINAEVTGKKQICQLYGEDGRNLTNHSYPLGLIGQISSIFPQITETTASSQQLQHQGEPDSVILKMEAVHSSKTSLHTSTTQHRNPKEDQMYPFLSPAYF